MVTIMRQCVFSWGNALPPVTVTSRDCSCHLFRLIPFFNFLLNLFNKKLRNLHNCWTGWMGDILGGSWGNVL